MNLELHENLRKYQFLRIKIYRYLYYIESVKENLTDIDYSRKKKPQKTLKQYAIRKKKKKRRKPLHQKNGKTYLATVTATPFSRLPI